MSADLDFINPFKQYYVVLIPEAIVSYRGLSPGAKLVYGRLQRYAGRKGVAFPNIPELASEVGLGERQTKEYVAELVEQKFIFRERVFARGNVYKFCNHPCLAGTAIGSARVNSGSFPNGRDAAQQSNGRDAAQYNGRDAAQQRGPVSLSPEEGHESGSINPLPPPGSFQNQNQLQPQSQNPDIPRTAAGPTLDASGIHPIDEETGEPVRAYGGKKNWKRPKPERPHGNSDRLRQLRESAHSSAGAGVAALLGPVRTADTPRPSAGAFQGFPARWNELVPAAPVDPSLLAPNPKAYGEPAFAARFDEICAKGAALIAGGADLQFGFLLSTDRATEQYRWQQLLAGQLEWMKPKAAKPSAAKSVAAAAAKNTRDLIEEMRRESERKANEARTRKQAEAANETA